MHSPELPDVIAVGAWLKNAACRLTAGVAHMSPVHGDLGDPQACTALEASVAALRRQSPRPVAAIAHDLHPDFFSTRLALRLADRAGRACHRRAAPPRPHRGGDGRASACRMPSSASRSTASAWAATARPGAASCCGSMHTHWARLGHLGHLALPGGDAAAREPWRMAASALHALGREEQIVDRLGPAVGQAAARGLRQLLRSGFNCPPTSSAGRWFDAAAGALGLSVRQAHEAEAAIALEQAAARWLAGGREPRAARSGAGRRGGRAGSAAVDRSRCSTRPPRRATKPLPASTPHWPRRWPAGLRRPRARRGVATVCLGGGCFANALLTERVTQWLQAQGLRVLRPRQQACGDAALALGQAWVAARQLGAAVTAPTLEERLTCA